MVANPAIKRFHSLSIHPSIQRTDGQQNGGTKWVNLREQRRGYSSFPSSFLKFSYSILKLDNVGGTRRMSMDTSHHCRRNDDTRSGHSRPAARSMRKRAHLRVAIVNKSRCLFQYFDLSYPREMFCYKVLIGWLPQSIVQQIMNDPALI